MYLEAPASPSLSTCSCPTAANAPDGPAKSACFNSFAAIVLVALCALFCAPASAQAASHLSSVTGNGNFGSEAIGSKSATTITYTFTFSTGGTIAAPVVTTMGATGLDFADAGTGTCTTNGTSYSYAANATCTVVMSFTPQYSGPRYGAVTLYSETEPIATGYAQGTGTGPQVNFLPGTGSTLKTTNTLYGPYSLAVDGSGNIYTVNQIIGTTTDQVLKETPSAGGYTGSIVANNSNGLADASSVAVDGSGSVYIADPYAGAVFKETPAAGGYVQSVVAQSAYYWGVGSNLLMNPAGVTVDGSGNAYILDGGANQVLKETLSAGSYVESVVIATGGVNEGSGGGASGIAVDGSGNVYVSDTSNNRVLKETPSGSSYTQSVVASAASGGLSYPMGLAVDGNGNLYVVDNGNSRIVKETLSAGSYTQSTVSVGGLSYVFAVALAENGNLYIGNVSPDEILEIDTFDPPTVSFATTENDSGSSSDSPQTVTVENIGNAALTFSALSYPTDFPEGGSVETDCKSTTSVNANGSCTLTIDFKPTTSLDGKTSLALSENITLKNNEFNVAGSQQLVGVTGAETAAPSQTATPVLSLPTGTYTVWLSVTISDSTPGAAIYYTTNGSTPTPSSTPYTGAITVSSSETLQAIAVATGYTSSAVASAVYTLNLPQLPPPSISPAAGTYATAQTVTISTNPNIDPLASIYYTTNGSTPTPSSTLYSGPITVSSTETIEAISVWPNTAISAVASAAYTINANATPTATPTFSLVAGTYTSAQSVTISDTTSGAAIYYTTNGTTPTPSSTLYSGAIAVSATETIKAIAVASGDTASAVASATYTINLPEAATPTFSPVAGTYTSAQTVTISDATSGATIYYTTNGTAPTTSSTVYSGAITVSASETLEAIATASGYLASSVGSAAYTISPNFTVAVVPTALTVTGGQSGTATVSVTPQNSFASAVTFACSGLPTGATCSFSPPTVTPSGIAASTTILTITTTAATAALHRNSNPLLPVSTLAAAFCLLGWKKRRGLQIMLLLAVSVLGLGVFTGCGGGSSSSTTPVTSTITVTATSGTGASQLQNTATLELTVQ
ncbi:MAG: chitobiase/beta-hexosaminidase C-terminal domain-containing protein [Terracidiphilus sp.]